MSTLCLRARAQSTTEASTTSCVRAAPSSSPAARARLSSSASIVTSRDPRSRASRACRRPSRQTCPTTPAGTASDMRRSTARATIATVRRSFRSKAINVPASSVRPFMPGVADVRNVRARDPRCVAPLRSTCRPFQRAFGSRGLRGRRARPSPRARWRRTSSDWMRDRGALPCAHAGPIRPEGERRSAPTSCGDHTGLPPEPSTVDYPTRSGVSRASTERYTR